MKLSLLFLTGLGVVSAHWAFCDETDDAVNRAARDETVQLLNSPSERKKEIAKDPKAQFVDKQVQALGNPDAIYGLSADVFKELWEKSGGDSQKMAEMVEKAKTDPEGFAKSLSPATRAKLRSVASETQAGALGGPKPAASQRP